MIVPSSCRSRLLGDQKDGCCLETDEMCWPNLGFLYRASSLTPLSWKPYKSAVQTSTAAVDEERVSEQAAILLLLRLSLVAVVPTKMAVTLRENVPHLFNLLALKRRLSLPLFLLEFLIRLSPEWAIWRVQVAHALSPCNPRTIRWAHHVCVKACSTTRPSGWCFIFFFLFTLWKEWRRSVGAGCPKRLVWFLQTWRTVASSRAGCWHVAATEWDAHFGRRHRCDSLAPCESAQVLLIIIASTDEPYRKRNAGICKEKFLHHHHSTAFGSSRNGWLHSWTESYSAYLISNRLKN